jgi:hypothetical protein
MSVDARISSMDFSLAQAKTPVARQAAISALVMAARRDSEPYVPMVSGDLRRSAQTESDPQGGRLTYGSAAVPYARPQYYGCPHKTYPGTTMRWFDVAKASHMAQWEKEAAAAVKEAMGNG